MSDNLDLVIRELKKVDDPMARFFQDIFEETKRDLESEEQGSETMESRKDMIQKHLSDVDMAKFSRLDPQQMRTRAEQAWDDAIAELEQERDLLLNEALEHLNKSIVKAAQQGRYQTTVILENPEIEKLEEFKLMDKILNHYAPFRINRREKNSFQFDFRKNENR